MLTKPAPPERGVSFFIVQRFLNSCHKKYFPFTVNHFPFRRQNEDSLCFEVQAVGIYLSFIILI